MKIFLLILGIVLGVLGSIQTFKYITDYSVLTQYGKGFIWGSIILIIVGVALIYLSFRKKAK